MKDILDLTYIQFKNILSGVGKKLNWNLHVAIHTSDVSAIEQLDNKYHPLSGEQSEDRKFTMQDAMMLKNMTNS